MRWSNDAPVLVPARCRPVALLVGLLFVLGGQGGALPSAAAQQSSGTFNVGLQVGRPGGLTGKIDRPNHTAYAGLLTTDGDEVVGLRLHRHWERPLPDSLVHVYGGPGLLVGGKALDDPDPLLELGSSIQAGLNFYKERFEVFLHVTPTLHFLPNLEMSAGGSVGLRYTFGGS